MNFHSNYLFAGVIICLFWRLEKPKLKFPETATANLDSSLSRKIKQHESAEWKKIISVYAKGMTTSDIEAYIKDIYRLVCSDTTISWRTNPENPYPQKTLDKLYVRIDKKLSEMAFKYGRSPNVELQQATDLKKIIA